MAGVGFQRARGDAALLQGQPFLGILVPVPGFDKTGQTGDRQDRVDGAGDVFPRQPVASFCGIGSLRRHQLKMPGDGHGLGLVGTFGAFLERFPGLRFCVPSHEPSLPEWRFFVAVDL